MSKAVKYSWVILFLVCSSVFTDVDAPFLHKKHRSLLINDTTLYQSINMSNGIIYLKGGEGEVKFDLRDTIKVKQLRKHYPFSKVVELLKERKKVDSILAATFFSMDHSPENENKDRKWKVALDPGHLASDMEGAKFEDKFIEFKNSTTSFFEAKLTYGTALRIKHLLEEKGIEVFLTHEYGKSSLTLSFEEWYHTQFDRSLDSMIACGSLESKDRERLIKLYESDSEYGRKVIFHRMYKQIELRNRARLVNDFKPDLTLVIHYNVDDENRDWVKPTMKNYNMTFVPGSFMKGELDHEEDKLHFLRLLFTNDLPRSIELSGNVIVEFEKMQLASTAKDTSVTTYLSNYCLPTALEGVFARNLSMTRLVEGPVCYGETLYQDNVKESVELSKNDCEIEGINVSCRVLQVAEAYTNAIFKYIKDNPK